MIKINLLPQRKPKRQAEPGQQALLVGVLFLMACGAGVYFGIDRRARNDLADAQEANAKYSSELNKRKGSDKVKGLPAARAALLSEQARSSQIDKLTEARAVPAHMLHELGEILTPGHQPTMTHDMAAKVKNDVSFAFRDDWDPKHVWIIDLTETKGAFVLTGGAESDGDVTQLAKRLQASAYFQEVTPTGGEKLTDKDSGITYYSFTIKGKVVY